MGATLIHSDDFQKYDYGSSHPLMMIRLKLTCELLKSYGVFGSGKAEMVVAEPCTREEAETVHTPEYLDVLKSIDEGAHPPNLIKYGLGYGDNPVFEGVYAGSMLATGGSLQASSVVRKGKTRVSFNIAGGLHHAMPGRASGFCYINDPAVAIFDLVKKGLKVAYVDIDAHHGDGVQHVFYETDRVLTISIHESGHHLFPGTGFPEDMGTGKGRGYSVNLPLLPGTGDEVFTFGFDELVPPLIEAYKPDVLVTQLGCDSFVTDPLTHLRFTTHGFCHAVKSFKAINRPWVALGGGGYDVTNVARAWSLAFAIMADVELPDELPETYKTLLKENGLSGEKLRDAEHTRETKEELKRERAYVDKALLVIKHAIFPVHRIK